MNIPLLAGLAFLVVGVYLLNRSLTKLKVASASENWPTTQGTLTKIVLLQKRLINGEMRDAENLHVQYEYQLEGKTYQGSEPAFYTLMYPETYEFAQKYQTSEPITVFYNPESHEQSVIITGRHPNKPYSDVSLSILAIVIGLGVAISAWLGYISS
jgi:hypothetical protein